MRARRLAGRGHHADAAAGRHRQRQDRGLSAQRGACTGPGAPGAGAGARDQPDAAARGTFCRAISRPPPRLAAQRPDAGTAPAPLAAGSPGPSRSGAGHAAGGVCVDAAAGPDRRRRRTRPVVQAAGGRALFGARPGHLSRPRRSAAGAAGLGHAVAGELVARRTGPLSPAEPDPACRRGRPARGAPARHEHRAAPGRRRAAGAGAGAAAGHRTAHRARRAEPAVPQPARLCAGAVLRRLWLEERLPALQRLARVPQGRPHAALPPLRLHRARAARLPRVRQPGHRPHGPRHRAPGGTDRPTAAAGRAWRASTPTAPAPRARCRRN